MHLRVISNSFSPITQKLGKTEEKECQIRISYWKIHKNGLFHITIKFNNYFKNINIVYFETTVGYTYIFIWKLYIAMFYWEHYV